MKERDFMFEKKSIIASAILAGLVSGMAFADGTAPVAADAGGSKVEKKNECKGHKDSCKGEKHSEHMKGDQDACSGPNGCGGKDMKKPAAEAAPAKKAP